MFTGIIEEQGEVLAWDRAADAARITVRAPLAASDAGHGDSISVSGVCLTVVDRGEDWFTADVMAESIAASTLGGVAAGDRVNLERAAALGDRLGGHVVQGHVDGTARVLSIEVSLIPETLAATTLGARAAGDAVNLETDVLARQVLRARAFEAVTA